MLRVIATIVLFMMSGALIILSTHVLVHYGFNYPTVEWRAALADPLWRSCTGMMIVGFIGLFAAVGMAK